jgi:hypothetical protein
LVDENQCIVPDHAIALDQNYLGGYVDDEEIAAARVDCGRA